jgi:hypothetical protein
MSLVTGSTPSRRLVGHRSVRRFGLLPAACLVFVLVAQAAACQEGGRADAPRTAVPDILAGEWYNGSSPLSYYRDRATGAWYNRGASMGGGYRFRPNGDYEEWSVVVNEFGACKTVFYHEVQGTMTVEGATVTLYPVSGRETLDSSCFPTNNYDRPRSSEFMVPEQFQAAVGPHEESGVIVFRRTSEFGVLTYNRP